MCRWDNPQPTPVQWWLYEHRRAVRAAGLFLLGLSVVAVLYVLVTRGATESLAGGVGGIAGSLVILLCESANRKRLGSQDLV